MKNCLTKSPLRIDNKNPAVFVARVKDAYSDTLSLLAKFDLSQVRGKKVLLKPNAGRIALPGQGITTNPQVVAAVIDAFAGAGAIVTVGDSPITGVKSLEALEATGIAAVARERKCPVIDMDARTAIEIPIPTGKAIHSIKVCPEVLENDLVVSIPVMKIHMHTGVTLSIKNMKGCLWRRSKVDLHMLPPHTDSNDKPLDIAIADMASVLCPHFVIIDGTIGMEGLGPSAGTPRELGVVVASSDPFSADAVACRLMGRDAKKIPHLRISNERGLGVIDLNMINISPANWQDFAIDFAPAPENMAIEFPNVTVLDKNSCSACQSSLLLFLQRHGEELAQYIPKAHLINIAIGKGHSDLPEGTLCIGNCTSCHKNKGTFVSGCPPVSSEIWMASQKMLNVDVDSNQESGDRSQETRESKHQQD